MGRSWTTILTPGAVVLSGLLWVQPVLAFELFGVTLWGEREVDAVETLDPQNYRVRLVVGDLTEDLDEDALKDALKASSALEEGKDRPAAGVAGLISTARGDYQRLLAALYELGHYGPTLSIQIEGQEAEDISLLETLPETAEVVIRVNPGPVFTFGDVRVRNAPPKAEDIKDISERTARDAILPGQLARASAIGAAEDEAIAAWRQLGRPLAKVVERQVIADHGTNQLDVDITLAPGPRGRMSEPQIGDTGPVRTEFVRYMAGVVSGKEFDPDDLANAERRLADLGVFSSIRIIEGDSLTEDGLLPIAIETAPRKPRRIGVGATLSSTEGIGLQGYWMHRNLFGRAERLRFEAEVEGLGQEERIEDLDYALGVTLRQPGLPRRDTSTIWGLRAEQSNFETYREGALTADVRVERRVNRFVTGGIGLEARISEVEDNDGTLTRFETFSLPSDVTYDRRNDRTDATEGFYLRLTAQPFQEFNFGNSGFRMGLDARGYTSLGGLSWLTLAGRARFGTVLAEPRDEIPTDLLFFAGGGGSVRGYPFRSIGVEESNGDITGGRSELGFSGELRADITRGFGLVGFVDGALVGADSFPGEGSFQMGAGLGLRYDTGLGPIRLDIARAIDPRPDDPDFAIYLGIGQAF
ncbi:MAG: autotransporter assembly complex family protein [Pseudomonadota bacterium]